MRRHQDAQAVHHFVHAGHLLAGNAFPAGPPELRLLALLRAQRGRLHRAAAAGRRGWRHRTVRHHWDRTLRNAVAVARETDRLLRLSGLPTATDQARLRAQSADTANYTLFLLHAAGVDLTATHPAEPTTPERTTEPTPSTSLPAA